MTSKQWGVALIILICAPLFYFTLKYLETPLMSIPYPYGVPVNEKMLLGADHEFEEVIKGLPDAHILILGDRMVRGLEAYLPTLTELTSERLRHPLNIISWAMPGEGIHRGNTKMKWGAQSLDKLPPIVILHYGADEFFENRFGKELEETFRLIENNFSIYENEISGSIIKLIPPSARLLYHPYPDYWLNDSPIQDPRRYTSRIQQKRMEYTFKFFELHLRQMVQLARRHDSTLMLITIPINLKEKPRMTCPNTLSDDIEKEISSIVALKEEGRFKEALPRAERLHAESPSNAAVAHLYGTLALKSRQFSLAREKLQYAAAVDCESWRANPVFNAIKRKVAAEFDLYLIDFDELVNRSLGRGELFLGPIFPQHLYYQQLIQILNREIRSVLQI